MTPLYHDRPTASNVIPLRANGARLPIRAMAANSRETAGDPWRQLTRDLIMAKAAQGELEPAVLDALLLAAGVAP